MVRVFWKFFLEQRRCPEVMKVGKNLPQTERGFSKVSRHYTW